MSCEHPKGKLISQAYCVRRTGTFIYRRKECPSCGKVFSTEEREVVEPKRISVMGLADLDLPLG